MFQTPRYWLGPGEVRLAEAHVKADTVLAFEIPPDLRYARVLTTAAETLAERLGLGKRENMRFQLAVEEFFDYLTQVAVKHCPVKAILTGKRYLAQAAFTFAAGELNLGALNFNSVVCISHDGEPPQDLGLLLAARIADRCHLSRGEDGAFTLQAEVDMVYPEEEGVPQDIFLKPPYRAEPCSDRDIMRHAVGLASARYPAWHCPASFKTPGKFLDMVDAGHFLCVAALDAASRPAGLMCWTRSGEKGLSFSGPFVFTRPGDSEQVARLLTDRFLETVAREGVEIVFSERATPDTPAGYFEPLGSLTLFGQAGTTEQPVLFRHLREDDGATVWSHPEIEGFLRDQYDRLAMYRDVLQAQPAVEYEHTASLVSTMVERGKSLAVLKPLLDGANMAENLAGHVCALREKNIANILYYMDLSRSWEAALSPALLAAGFKPRLILPNAGRSDVAVFQYAPAD